MNEYSGTSWTGINLILLEKYNDKRFDYFTN